MLRSLRLPPWLVRAVPPPPVDDHGDAGQNPGLDERHRIETRAELINETLQISNYSSVTHLAVVAALCYMFWDNASRSYLSGLAASISLIVAATLFTTWHYRNAYRKAVEAPAVRRAFQACRTLAFLIGLAWSTMPAVLLPPSDGNHRLIVVATTAGLIADAYVVGPIVSVSFLFAAPIVVGGLIGLSACESPFGEYISVLLCIYTAFIFFSVRRMSLLSYQRIWQRVVVQHQGETIGLLLNDFEEGASDWLWETDPHGQLHHVPARMAATMGLPVASLQQRSLEDLLRGHAAPDDAGAAAALSALSARAAFRDLSIRLAGDEGTRWLSLNGKPAFDQRGAFTGYRGVGADITQSQEAQTRIEYLAEHDTLTGLPNRAAFQAVVQAACRKRPPESSQVALLCLDLDGFKTVNDSHGHGTGDRLLQDVADRLRDVAGRADRVFRLGGDEFAIVHDCDRPGEAEALAHRLIAAVCRPYRIDTAQLLIGVSIGIAYTPQDALDPENLLSRADLALYNAKAAGKGCCCVFKEALEDRVLRQRRLDADMRLALGTDAMQLHYQPLVDLQSGRVVGFEALLRWERPGSGWISPGEIIPIAESTGFIVEIGRWALRRACADAVSWPDLRVAVNISSLHVRSPRFYEDVVNALQETGLPPNRLEVEITETVWLDREPMVSDNLRRLRQLGVRIALDDFGTGYSGLSYLLEFPFDKVKVDRSFIQDLHLRPEKLAVVEAIATMARALSMELTVEGVETPEQLVVLQLKRCGTAQGFLYSQARPNADVGDLIRRLNDRAVGARDGITFVEAAE